LASKYLSTDFSFHAELKSISNPKDYTLTWWDYGYPIWYYSNTNTLIDGGKHHHDNFIISEILTTSSQVEAARLSRIAVEEYVDNNYTTVANSLFKNGKKEQLNVNNYLEELKFGDIKLPKKTRDVYLYLPHRMLNILPTVSIFSNRDLYTGKEKKKMLFYKSQGFKNNKGVLSLGRGMVCDTNSGMMLFGKQKTKIKYIITTELTNNGHTRVANTKQFDKNGEVFAVGQANGKIILFDAYSGKLFLSLPKKADAIASTLSTLPAYNDWSTKTDKNKYYLLFNQTFSGVTLTEKFGEDDGAHIVGLIKHRLDNPMSEDIELKL